MEYIPLTADYIDQFTALFQREKGHIRPHQMKIHLNWSFFDLPLANNDLPIVEVAVENGRVLGAMGAIPQTFLDGEREIPGAFFVDWLVDRRERRRKIGSTLIRRAAARYPVAVHMGSTPEGYATCATLGARDCGETVSARRILNPRNWAAGSDRANPLMRLAWSSSQHLKNLFLSDTNKNSLTVQRVEPAAIDQQLQACSRQLAMRLLCTLRTGARWEWLLKRSPLYRGFACEIARNGEIIGYAALVLAYRSRRLVGTIADVCPRSIVDVPDIVAAASAELASLDLDGISLTISAKWGEQVIDRLGFDSTGSRMMGTWLQPGWEYLLERPWYMTGAENLSIAAGIDLPLRLPSINKVSASLS